MLFRSALKRKFEGPENGEHKDKKFHVEERKPSISELHIDVGQIYQLCRTRKYPRFSSNSAAACLRSLHEREKKVFLINTSLPL